MEKNWENPYATRTAFDRFGDELHGVIDGRTKYSTRAKGKPMANRLGVEDSHTVDREEHMKQAAIIAKRIAKKLGLNEVIVYIGMLMHDAGHPFGAHEGEETLKAIGRILNSGYYHHNAKGVDVVLSEDIIQKFIEAIPDAKNNPELRKKLEEESWYFFDVIVGHDGEATQKDIEQQQKNKIEFNSIREAVLYKVSKANRKDEYKCGVESLEGNVSKPSDVIAYLKSDMLDAFRKGIIKRYSDDYLECLGELFFEKDDKKLTRDEKIKEMNQLIRKIQEDKLREQKNDVYNTGAEDVLGAVDKILQELTDKGIDVLSFKENEKNEKMVREIVTKYITRYRAEKYFANEDKHSIESQTHKIIDCVQKCLKMRNSVIEELTTMMQEELIEDYCNNTIKNFEEIYKIKDLSEEERKALMAKGMNFSDRVLKIMYDSKGLKNLNHKEYVRYTKKEYQVGVLPKAVYKAVKHFSKLAVKTGLIRDKFYDKSILDNIKDENVRNAMKLQPHAEHKYERTKRKIGIDELKPIKRPKLYKTSKKFKNKFPNRFIYRRKFFKDFYAFTQRQGERFARTCEDVYYAIPYTVRDLVKLAVSSDYKPNAYLPEQEKKKVFEIRKELEKRFGQEFEGVAITRENLEKYIEEKIEIERTKNFQYNVATEIAIKQFGGMNDNRIKDVLIKMGFLSRIKYKMQDKQYQGDNDSVNKLIKQYERRKG